jgi:undecaprenyl-diphosphatase
MSSCRARVLCPVASTLLFFTLFVGSATIILARGATGFDSFVREGVHETASSGLTTLMALLTRLGSPIVLGPLSVLLFVVFRLAGRQGAASLLAWAMIGAILLENALKFSFQRARPEPFFGIIAPETYSLPSGHALFSACFYGVIASALAARVANGFARAAIWICAVLLIAAIGFSRIYLGVHFPTDVLAGYILAAFWLSAVQLWTAWPAAIQKP